MSQGLVLLLLGGAVLRISAFSTSYLNYVKPGFRPFLIAAGAVVFILGAIILVQEWRKPAKEGPDEEHGEEHAHHDDGHGHDHAHGPRVAWLMTLPVFAIFLIAPPALGSYAAAR
jgi:ABC-type nickel/cobalt efflux system permease component RcnA